MVPSVARNPLYTLIFLWCDHWSPSNLHHLTPKSRSYNSSPKANNRNSTHPINSKNIVNHFRKLHSKLSKAACFCSTSCAGPLSDSIKVTKFYGLSIKDCGKSNFLYRLWCFPLNCEHNHHSLLIFSFLLKLKLGNINKFDPFHVALHRFLFELKPTSPHFVSHPKTYSLSVPTICLLR